MHSSPKRRVFVDGWCLAKKPNKKQLRHEEYEKHLKNVSNILEQKQWRVTVPLKALKQGCPDDTLVEAAGCFRKAVGKFISASDDVYALISSDSERKLAAFLNVLYPLLKSYSKVAIDDCKGRIFGLSAKVVFCNQTLSDSIKKSIVSRNITLSVLPPSSISPYQEYPFGYAVSGHSYTYFYSFIQTLADSKIRCLPDLFVNDSARGVFGSKGVFCNPDVSVPRNMTQHIRKLPREWDAVTENTTHNRCAKRRKIDANDYGLKGIKTETGMVNHNNDNKAGERVILNCCNCNSDLRDKDVWRCSQCKAVYYCGKHCQSIHWKIHQLQCICVISKPSNIKVEHTVSVDDWSCYAVIYWLNRLDKGRFKDIKYRDLKKHLVIGKIRGSDMLQINAVILRMMGIYDLDEQQIILNGIWDIVSNDEFDNVFANTMNIESIPRGYLDPVLYELMQEPVRVRQSGYIYEKAFITKYIVENKSDPITRQYLDLKDIDEYEELKREIVIWTNNGF